MLKDLPSHGSYQLGAGVKTSSKGHLSSNPLKLQHQRAVHRHTWNAMEETHSMQF
jgi:hypothetical protein